MPRQDQLEIVGPGGQVEFYLLDPARGVTNIGRHPDNDVVLDSPNIDLFQAVLDHQEKPYHIMVLSEEAEARLEGQPLVPNVSQELHAWDTVELDGYAIILLEGAETAKHEEAAFVPTPVPAVPLPREKATAPSGFVAIPARPPDQVDEIIVAELSEREWTLDVEQTASFELTVTNGGSIVANFEVRLEGVEGSWVTVSPDTLNLNEGARGTVALTITPPRLPTSSAGPHHMAVMVTSPNYPDRASRLGATLTINPYYEFAVGELSPKLQTISWRKRSGQVTIPFINKSNTEASFRLDAEDDERGCRFEFEVPGEGLILGRQAEVRLRPEASYVMPVRITPIRRRLVGLRKRSFLYTVSTSLLEGALTPRTMMGQVKSAPLISVWLILLEILLVLAAMVQLFRLAPPELTSRQLQESGGTLPVSEALTLEYDARRYQCASDKWYCFFSNLINRVNGAFLDLTIERQFHSSDSPDLPWETVAADLVSTHGSLTDDPKVPVTYRLTVRSRLPLPLTQHAILTPDPVEVTCDVSPAISMAEDALTINLGESATLTWTVQHATRLVLRDDEDGTLIEEFDKPQGKESYEVRPPVTTTYRLEAYSQYAVCTPVAASKTVAVIIPPPFIEYFVAEPSQIATGMPVALRWQVVGATEVKLMESGGDWISVPEAIPYVTRWPEISPETTYTLWASSGKLSVTESLTVSVDPPPEPPEIKFFEAKPPNLELVKGETGLVQLSWQVYTQTTTTDIEISGPSLFSPISNLTDTGSIAVTVDGSTMFVLTAYNQDQKTSRTTYVTVTEPGAPKIDFFKAVPEEAYAGDKVLLAWGVSGEPTNLEITTADGLSLTGLESSGEKELPVDKTTLFVLTAFKGAQSSNMTALVTVNEAPPDAPEIAEFYAEFPEGGMVLHELGTDVYKILEGANVTLKWVVLPEDVKVELNTVRKVATEVNVGSVYTDTVYVLRAWNETDDDVAELSLRVVARELPPPENFEYDPDKAVFSWTYPRPDDIQRFRLYRTSPGKHELVAETPELPEPVPGDVGYVYSWTLETCKEGTYYLVAYYRDPYDDIWKETDAAEDSWGVRCP